MGIEYFVAQDLTRKLPPIQWHRQFHVHAVEIATSRIQVLDMPEDRAKEVVEAAAKTGGLIYHLWRHGSEFSTERSAFRNCLDTSSQGMTRNNV